MPLVLRDELRERAVGAACRVAGALASLAIRAGARPVPHRILVVRRCCFGDVLLTTPLLAALKRAYPAASITYATGAWSRPALAGIPDVDRVITLPGSSRPADWLPVARRLRARHFDLAVIPERSPLPQLLAAAAGIPRRVGLDSGGRGFMLTDRVPVRGIRHETDRALDLAYALGAPVVARRPRYVPSCAARAKVSRLLRSDGNAEPFLVVHPGGGANPGVSMPAKRWPPERFAAAAVTIAQKYDLRIVVTGGLRDEAVAHLCSTAISPPALNLTGQLGWDEHAALVECARLYLGNDTGATHLAVAVGAPVVAVFGPTDPAMYGPLDGVSEAVWSADCAEVAERGDLTRIRDIRRCIDGITVEAVLAAAERVLARADNDARTHGA